MSIDMKDLPKLALGAWAWGSADVFGEELSPEQLKPVFAEGQKLGLNLWDNAYVYGQGKAENKMGVLLKDYKRDEYIISEKLTPRCMNNDSPDPVAEMMDGEMARLGIEKPDIYWIHHAIEAPKWITKLAEYYEGKDYVPLIGVSNHTMAQIQEAEKILEDHGLKLGAVQNHYSLLNRTSEKLGIIDYCREKGMLFVPYMVLEQGALTGKYDTKHPMPEGKRGDMYNPKLDKLEIMNAELKNLADKYGAAPAQIPIAWAVNKGTLPIVGVTKVKHVDDAYEATKIQLTAGEIEDLEKLGDELDLDTVRFWEDNLPRESTK
ncbi:MAG: aldo/keto reductase [Eubacteriales bacterium]|nr:aldo/keto reductase [Eubacteriales bacterium]